MPATGSATRQAPATSSKIGRTISKPSTPKMALNRCGVWSQAPWPALIDAILILVAYILYPFVVAIFGFFYIFYGSVLYIFGPIVIALMPLGATNRSPRRMSRMSSSGMRGPSCMEALVLFSAQFRWDKSARCSTRTTFWADLGTLEGSFLIGAASIIYSLAIAVIPFIAKRIVSGDVGSTAGAMIGDRGNGPDSGRGSR